MIQYYLEIAIRVLLMLVPATLLIVSPNSGVPYVTGKVIYAYVLIGTAFILWLILAAHSPEHRPRRSWLLWAALALLGAFALAGVAGVSPVRSFWSEHTRMGGVINMAHWTAYAVMLGTMFKTAEHWRQLLIAAIAVGAVFTAYGLYTYVSVPDANYESTMGDRFFAGVTTSFAIGLVLVYALAWGRGRHWLWICPLLLLHMIALWSTAALGGVFAAGGMLTAAGLAYLWLRRPAYVRRMLAGGVIAVVIAAGAAGVIAIFFYDDIPVGNLLLWRVGAAIRGEDNSANNRLLIYKTALSAWQSRQVLGYGPENFYVVWGEHAGHPISYGEYVDDAHNQFLEALSTAGSVGALAYLALVAAVGVVAVRIRGPDRGLDAGFAILGGGYLVISLVAVDNVTFSLTMYLIIGYYLSVDFGRRPATWPQRYAVATRLSVASLAMVAVIAVLLIGGYSARIFASAQKPSPASTAAEAIDNLRDKRDLVPQYADFYRNQSLVAISHIGIQEEPAPGDDQLSFTLGTIPPNDLALYADYIDAEVEAGLSIEPYNWLLVMRGLQAFIRLSLEDAQYLEQSRVYLDRVEAMLVEGEYLRLARASYSDASQLHSHQ